MASPWDNMPVPGMGTPPTQAQLNDIYQGMSPEQAAALARQVAQQQALGFNGPPTTAPAGWFGAAATGAPAMPATSQVAPNTTTALAATTARPAAAPAQPAPANNGKILSDQIDARSIQALKDQGLTVDQIKQRLAGLQGKDLPIDFSPLAALSDSWFGTKLSQAAQPIETSQQRQAAITQLQDAVLKGQQGMSQDEINMLKTKLSNQWHEDEITSQAANRKAQIDATAAFRESLAQAKEGKANTAEFDKATQSFMKDAAVVDTMKKSDEVARVKDQITQAQVNPVANNTLPMSIVRLYANRISQQELAAAGGAKDLEDRAKQFSQQMESGTLTPENAKFMTDLATSLEASNNKIMQGHIERHANIYSQVSGMPMEKAADAITGGLYSKVKPPPGPSASEKADAAKWLADPANAKDARRADIQKIAGGQ